jgi:myosin heavy subunit
LDKNNDTLHDDLQRLLYNSKRQFLVSIFPPLDEEIYMASTRRFKSVSGRFQQQLEQLMNKLNSTTSHFIRCIKPNEAQKPEVFHAGSVMQQLRYNGMCTALRLMQQGFPTRCSFEDLYERYASLMPTSISRLKPMTFCEALLVALDLNGGRDFQMGLTKVFFRAGKLQFLDDLTSNSKDTINSIVGKVKKYLARKRFKAAIFGVVSMRRLMFRVQEIRKIHQVRKLGRDMVALAKVWAPLVNKARQNVSSQSHH